MEYKHPKALPFMFLTEMWERFGFYIIQGLLVFYLVNHLGFTDDDSYAIGGAFTALAYMMSWGGGVIADHILGFRKTIYLGGFLLVLGYFLLALPLIHQSLFFALAMITTGTGLFKPNISSLLGKLYKTDDPRREAGFTIFYIGIYVGIVLATTTSGFIQENFGWHASFAAAAIGLVIGMTIFFFARELFQSQDLLQKTTENLWLKVFRKPVSLVIVILLMITISSFFLEDERLSSILLISLGLLLIFWMFFRAFFYEAQVRNRLLALLVLFLISIMFWAVYFQMFFSANLFIEREVNRHFFGIEIPAVFFIGIQAISLIILGVFLARIWRIAAEHNHNPSMPFKFALAMLVIGGAFLLLLVGIHLDGGKNLVNPLWIVLAYIFVALAELLLSAIGLSAVTVLAPPNLVGTLMGIWFVALGMGGKIAGIIAEQSGIPKTMTERAAIIEHYYHAFSNYAFYAIGIGIIALILTPTLRTLSRGQTPTWRTIFTLK